MNEERNKEIVPPENDRNSNMFIHIKKGTTFPKNSRKLNEIVFQALSLS